MIGALPKSLTIGGKEYEIRSDFRNILTIFEAFDDDTLTDEDKAYVVMKRLYVELNKIPRECQQEAYVKAMQFIECHGHDGNGQGQKSPRVVDWVHDEHLIFPAVNKVAGCEVRALPYLHWWTFLGYFESVDNEGVWSFVLTIRQKRAKGKKLEKHEQEFYKNNRSLCDIKRHDKPEKPEDTLASMFENLMEGGQQNGK